MKTLLIFSLLIWLNTYLLAQPQSGNVGLSVVVQNEQLDFLVPILLTNKLAISPTFGIRSISDQYTDVVFGGILRYYFQNQIVSPFIGGRIGAIILSPKEGDTTTDLIFGPLFGGEYYFTSNFSVGIELQLNIISSGDNSNRFGNPGGTNINTATAFFATIYF
jgi:hypothetical protein